MGRQRPHGQEDGTGRPELIAPLLTRLRKGRGWSQLRLAEKLCDVSGSPTVSRHEVSRWERGERVPGSFWLTSLAAALETSLEELEAAVGATRERIRGPGARPPGKPWLWRPLVALDLAAALDHLKVDDLRDLAHAWLAGPQEGWDDVVGQAPSRGSSPASGGFETEPEPVLLDGTGRDVLGFLEARLGRLRRADDLLGGVELAGRVDRRLRQVIPVLKKIGDGRSENALRNRALRLIAGYAQLAGWVHADAGNGLAARRAYRVGLKAAAVAGDRELGAHVLGALSNLSLDGGNAHEALLVARTGLAGITGSGSSLLRALLLHRAAMAAARLRERREAELMLVEAERVVERSSPEDEPEWLYWLDHGELGAMTGRCLAVLGRPLRAVRMLSSRSGGGGPRSSALYGCWLARAYVGLGEVEEARRVMGRVRVQAAGVGSRRVEGVVRHVEVEGAAWEWVQGPTPTTAPSLYKPTVARTPVGSHIGPK
jgi:transcriptional regulator with XRE-family HTH domain